MGMNEENWKQTAEENATAESCLMKIRGETNLMQFITTTTTTNTNSGVCVQR